MLIGEFQHNIDQKGRLIMPVKFRSDLGERFIVSRGLDNCLFVYSIEEWKKLEERIAALPLTKSRDLQRYFFSGAVDVELDKLGRILIPSTLREFASLTKDVVINGASSRAEIWSKENWTNYNSKLTSDKIAQAMEDIGF